MSLLPEVGIPRVSVQVSYPDAAARTVEEAAVAPLRNTLLQVNGLTDLRSRTRDESAVLYLDFPFGTDADLAFIEINEKIDQAMNGLPREVPRPRVLATDVSDIPVVQLSVTLADTAAGADLLELSALAERVLRRRLEQIPEIAFADLSGHRSPRLAVRPDRAALRALNLTEDALANLLREANVELGGLLLNDGQYQYAVRFSGNLRTADDLRALYLPVGNGRIVALGDLATVTYEETPPRGAFLYDGRPGVVFTLRKRADARLFALRDNLAALVTDLRRDYPRLRFQLDNDQTAILRASIDNLRGGLLYGAGFAILVLFLFFRGWRRPLLIGLAVPVALLLAVLGFYLYGLSINVISLAGLLLGLGLMIDNSIIVLDNIASYQAAAAGAVEGQEMGEDDERSEHPRAAARAQRAEAPPPLPRRGGRGVRPERSEQSRVRVAAATNEVIRPLLTSALTTVAVFLPLVLLSGIAGALFRDQAVAVTLALAASLIVAYFVLPLLADRMGLGTSDASNVRQPNQKSPPKAAAQLKVKSQHEVLRSKASKISDTPERSEHPRAVATSPPQVAAQLKIKNQRSKVKNLPLLLLPLWFLLGYLLLTALPAQSFPRLSRLDYRITVDWNEPSPLNLHRTRVRALMNDWQARHPGHLAAFIGEDRFLLNEENRARNATELQAYLPDNPEPNFAEQTLNDWRAKYPNATFQIAPLPNLFDRIFLNDAPFFELRLRAATSSETPAWSTVQPLLNDLAAAGHRPAVPPRDEAVALRVDYEQLRRSRVDPARLRARLLTLFGENEVTSLRANDRALPVLLAGDATLSAARLRAATVPNRDGNDIPLDYLVTTTRRPDYRVLTADRSGQYLSLAFPGEPDEAARAQILTIVQKYPAFVAQTSGRFLTDQDRVGELTGVLLVSLLLLYLILAAQFEGLRLPFVVLLVVPVSLVGSLAALWLTGGSVNLLSLIGMVVTGGIVVNDAIIKVDMIERGRAAGMDLSAAIAEASRRRLRAIVMTSLTTILALVPVLFTSGLGAELQQPLAITVIGGLVVGTLGSLYVVPGLYRLLSK